MRCPNYSSIIEKNSRQTPSWQRRANAITTILVGLMMLLSLCSCGGTESGQAVRDDGDEAGLLLLEVNGQTLEAEFEDNEAAQALKDLIGEDGLKLDLTEYGGFEKVGPLPESLPTSDEQMDVTPGDIVLYQGNQLSLLYGENSWSYTKLGRIKDVDEARLGEILGDGDVSVTLKYEDFI